MTHEILPSTSLSVATESVAAPMSEERVQSQAEQMTTSSEKPVIASPVIGEPSQAVIPRQSSPVLLPSSPTAKAGYGWLTASLAARLAEVKHYPATARHDGLQGKVLLRAVIRADGSLADVRTQKSSGHIELDEAAKDALRQACPIPMRHELGRPEITINVPVNFQLAME